MKLLILNGNSDKEKQGIDSSVLEMEQKLQMMGHTVNVFHLREMNFNDCTGCFGCWVKTPGTCVHNDDMKSILKKIITSDLQILFSDVQFGMIGPSLVSAINRLIPLGCAFMRIDEHNKTAHYPRYERIWRPALVIEDFEERNGETLRDISYCIKTEDDQNYVGTYILGHNEEELYNAINNY